MKNFVEAAQFAFAALGGALGAVLGGFDGFLYALIAFVPVSYTHLRTGKRHHQHGAKHCG